MKIFKSITDFTNWRNSVESQNVGFVPTMGALHLGHFSLIKQSLKKNSITVVSIFVNKLQFGPNEDFDNYPRTLEKDLKALESMKVDVVFLPAHAELYGQSFSFAVSENSLSTKLEGAARPQFFNGVCTVVLKLFNIVKPNQTFFGQKDIQQLRIIQKMTLDLNLNIEVIGCKTIREKNGLAMSSRNQYLNDEEKCLAANIYLFLQESKKMILKKAKYSDVVKSFNKNIKRVGIMKVDYISVACINTFDELNDNVDLSKKDVVISCAIFLNRVRLIDNIIV